MSIVSTVSALATRIANEIRDAVKPRLLPAGGENGQILMKTNESEYSTTWIEAPEGGGDDIEALPPLEFPLGDSAKFHTSQFGDYSVTLGQVRTAVTSQLADVATSGSYNDLTDTPEPSLSNVDLLCQYDFDVTPGTEVSVPIDRNLYDEWKVVVDGVKTDTDWMSSENPEEQPANVGLAPYMSVSDEETFLMDDAWMPQNEALNIQVGGAYMFTPDINFLAISAIKDANSYVMIGDGDDLILTRDNFATKILKPLPFDGMDINDITITGFTASSSGDVIYVSYYYSDPDTFNDVFKLKVSLNMGDTFIDRDIDFSPYQPYYYRTSEFIKCSADGSTVMLIANDIAKPILSTDYGVTWAVPPGLSTATSPSFISMSANGQTLAVLNADQILVSLDGGATLGNTIIPPAGFGYCPFAISADGTKIVIVGLTHMIYSSDSGATWIEPVMMNTTNTLDDTSVFGDDDLSRVWAYTHYTNEMWTAVPDLLLVDGVNQYTNPHEFDNTFNVWNPLTPNVFTTFQSGTSSYVHWYMDGDGFLAADTPTYGPELIEFFASPMIWGLYFTNHSFDYGVAENGVITNGINTNNNLFWTPGTYYTSQIPLTIPTTFDVKLRFERTLLDDVPFATSLGPATMIAGTVRVYGRKKGTVEVPPAGLNMARLIPAGGFEGEILRKATDTDYSVEWIPAPPKITVAPTAPSSPNEGDIWIDISSDI